MPVRFVFVSFALRSGIARHDARTKTCDMNRALMKRQADVRRFFFLRALGFETLLDINSLLNTCRELQRLANVSGELCGKRNSEIVSSCRFLCLTIHVSFYQYFLKFLIWIWDTIFFVNKFLFRESQRHLKNWTLRRHSAL